MSFSCAKASQTPEEEQKESKDLLGALADYKKAKLAGVKQELAYIKRVVTSNTGGTAFLKLLAYAASGVNKDVDAYLREEGLLGGGPEPPSVDASAQISYIEELKTGKDGYDAFDSEFASGIINAGGPVSISRIVKSTAAKESGYFAYAHRVHENGADLGIMGINGPLHVKKVNKITNPAGYQKDVMLASVAANVEVGTRFLLYLQKLAGTNTGLMLEWYGPHAKEANRTRRGGVSYNATKNAYKNLYGNFPEW